MRKLDITGERLVPGVYGKIAVEHLHRYALTLEFARNKKVLDIASGEGYGSNLLAKYADQVIGIDISELAVSHAQMVYRKKNLSFQIGSVLDIPCQSKSFDLIVSFETIEHIAEHQQMISEIKRVLKPNGILIISTPEKAVYSDQANYSNPFHVKELYEFEFVDLLSREFKSIQIGYQKYFKGSFILPANHQSIDLNVFRGGFDKIEQDNFLKQEYLIAICSDYNFDQFPLSIFESGSLNNDDFEEEIELRIKKIKSCFRYRLADFFFKPWDLFKGKIK